MAPTIDIYHDPAFFKCKRFHGYIRKRTCVEYQYDAANDVNSVRRLSCLNCNQGKEIKKDFDLRELGFKPKQDSEHAAGKKCPAKCPKKRSAKHPKSHNAIDWFELMDRDSRQRGLKFISVTKWLRSVYRKSGYSQLKLSRNLGMHSDTLRKKMRELGIPTRRGNSNT